ncbi:TIGR02391 family protein [Roseateles sp. PN1]|uniref:TIGR02391 family protein n=1 Tax=Roseateles sp. PN1 TaxID=3137372 RepID=UPI003138B1E9
MDKTWKSEEEISEAINLLQCRIDSLQAKSVERDIREDSVNIRVLESAFTNTIREVFGPNSHEFHEYGRLDMFRGPLRVGITKPEIVEARLKGREYMVAICAELIGRLQQKIQMLRRRAASTSLQHGESLHPRIAATTQELLENGHAWEAVFAASKALVIYVKELSGRTDIDGVPLMRTVFSKNNPVLKFNALADQTDLDEQEGMMHLYEGAVMALRNPGGHAFPNGPDKRALQYIQLLSLLASRAEEAAK